MVFLSYTSELEKYPHSRSFVTAALEGIRQAGYVAKAMRDFTADPQPPAVVCQQAVRQCGMYVGLLGFRYGSPVRDRDDISYTQLEYLTAGEVPIPRLVFLLDPEAENLPPKAVLDPQYGSRQVTFRENVLAENHHTCKFFKSADELQRLIFEALRNQSPWQEPPDGDDPTKFLRDLQQDTAYINLRGIRGLSIGARIPIEELYIPLTTTVAEYVGDLVSIEANTTVFPGSQRVELAEVLKNPKVLLVGDPGAGKTTFLHRIANALCEAWLEMNPHAPQQRLGLDDRPLPILVKLAQLVEHIRQSRGRGDTPSLPDVPEWLPHFLGTLSHGSAMGLDKKFFLDLFKKGGAILLLDGLDEAPSRLDRQRLAALIEKMARAYDKCRFVVTCRPAAFNSEIILHDFTSFRIDPLELKSIRLFLQRWCEASYRDNPSRASQLRDELLDVLNRRVEIRRLARNPVMLTALAVLHWNARRLPEQRADLYESIIAWLASAREQRDGRQPAERCVRLLWKLALEMQNPPQGRQVQVSKRWAAERIAPEFREFPEEERLSQAERFLDEEEVDSGIVVGRGDFVQFWHLTFQEYLAARAIAAQNEEHQRKLLLGRTVLYEPEWREVVLLLAGVLHHQGRAKVDGFFTTILDQFGQQPSLIEYARSAGLLSAVVQDLEPVHYQPTDHRYQQCLNALHSLFDPAKIASVPRDVAIEAAKALGRAGDPRFNQPNWVYIPAGKTLVGAQRKDPVQPNYDPDAYDNEAPVHEVYTGSFEIGKFLVTVQEYAAFIQDGGYTVHQREYWSLEGWTWKEVNAVEAPELWDKQLSLPNCPVVRINYWEANAYCRWLTIHDDTFEYRLPTEAEWEYTTRRGQKTYSPFSYPGVSPKTEICCDVGDHSVPVGLFPKDKTIDGVLDMNGNVREWIYDITHDIREAAYTTDPIPARQLHSDKIDFAILRGGSFNSSVRNSRSALRSHVSSYNRYADVGFRVVRRRRPVALKGHIPQHQYPFTLADVYAKHMEMAYPPPIVNQKLSSFGHIYSRVNSAFLNNLFPLARKTGRLSFPALPCVMGGVPRKLDFNLLYQDTRLKLAVEEKLQSANTQWLEEETQGLLEVVAILLHTTRPSGALLWEELTDNNLDALIYSVLDQYDPGRAQKLLEIGHKTNELALVALPTPDELARLDLMQLIDYHVFAGTVWWDRCEPVLQRQFADKGAFAISDVEVFLREVLSKECHLLFFFDDNGELVWDLALIRRLLAENPHLKVTGVAGKQVVANDANLKTLERCLEHEKLYDLLKLQHNSRFTILAENKYSSSIDLNFCTEELLNLIGHADVVLIKGVNSFECMQRLPVVAYYSFVVYSRDSQICTGLSKNSGVFVRVPQNTLAYEYENAERTLRKKYPAF
jgi:formylglycine-generating enzyme required for sulfatase activity